jgi:molybdopterin-guanine dinucleotide biosynthesis protein A
MGEDKAFLDLGGQTLLDRALGVVSVVCGSVMIVGEPAKFARYGTTVADIFPGCGPLAGIHAALTHSTAELNVMLAVDMPFVSRKLLAFLFAASEGSDAVVTVPKTLRGLQPLCAVYRREFAVAAEEALRAGKYKVDRVFSGVSIRVIGEGELTVAGFSEQNFFNVNTPQDRMAALGE